VKELEELGRGKDGPSKEEIEQKMADLKENTSQQIQEIMAYQEKEIKKFIRARKQQQN
jgi:hypothetical protein